MLAVANEALRLGIDHFETARGYGSSECQLGRVLEQVGRDRVILQTKVQPCADPERFSAEVRDSLARLRVARVDLLALHGVNDHRALWHACRPGGCLAAARRLQARGLVGSVGFSGHGPTEVLLDAVRHRGDGGFDYVNLHWYAIFRRHTAVLEQAAARDLGVFIISPTDKGGLLHRPPSLLGELCAPLSPMQFNDLVCLLRPEVTTISVGASRPSDFHDHHAALTHLDQPDLVTAIDRRWQAAMHAATGQPRPDDHWPAWPSFADLPGYINVAYIFWLENLVLGWDLGEYARARYALLGRENAWVPGNNAAHADDWDWTEIARGTGLTATELVERLRRAHALLRTD
jgi:predicted aldo/keto reductase-like oxidoreductase